MKANLRDTTIIIPIFIDSTERLENLIYVVEYIQVYFHTHIIIIESGDQPTKEILEMEDVQYVFHKKTEDFFHRTKLLNSGIRLSRTRFVCLYDADVFFEPRAYAEAQKMCSEGYSMVYPYGGKFVDVGRDVLRNGDIAEFASFATNSVGGAVFINRGDYWDAGLENENIVGWGPEDNERLARMIKLGYKTCRVEGTCWHIVHPRGTNDGPKNPYTERNNEEYEGVKEMSKEMLKEYIETWPWAKQLTR